MIEYSNLQPEIACYNNTRKKRRDKKDKKTDLWKLYDNEIENENKKDIECLYSNTTNENQRSHL